MHSPYIVTRENIPQLRNRKSWKTIQKKKITRLLWTNQITEKHGKCYHDGFPSVIFEKLEIPLLACQLQWGVQERNKWVSRGGVTELRWSWRHWRCLEETSLLLQSHLSLKNNTLEKKERKKGKRKLRKKEEWTISMVSAKTPLDNVRIYNQWRSN